MGGGWWEIAGRHLFCKDLSTYTYNVNHAGKFKLYRFEVEDHWASTNAWRAATGSDIIFVSRGIYICLHFSFCLFVPSYLSLPLRFPSGS
jgi:hypothetical protein